MLTRCVETVWGVTARRAALAVEVLLPVAAIFTFVIFPARAAELSRRVAAENNAPAVAQPLPDGEHFGYDAGWLRGRAVELGADGRAYYISSQLRADIAFPLVYGVLLAAAVAGPWDVIRRARGFHVARWFVLLPPLAAGFDIAENFAVIRLLADFPNNWNDTLAAAAGWFTPLKWLFSLVSVLVAVVGAVWAWRVRRGGHS